MIQKKVPVKIIPFIIVVEENAHQIPFRPIEVFPRIIASGILALVKRMLMMLHRFVLPSPDMAPMVVSSMHRKASLNPMITRSLTAVAMAEGSWKKIVAIGVGVKIKIRVISNPQIPIVQREARYPFLTRSIFPAP